jgi:O-acetyl-ADP-ribose deacetylase (regulator of RNase III)
MPEQPDGATAIDVVVDDLAFVAADAVVRAADDRLEPVTPAVVRLDRVAGDRFAGQRRVQSPLAVGSAVVTGGGDLAAPFVLHAVIQGRDEPPTESTIRRALLSAWQQAAEWGLDSLATAPLGTGAGQLTLEDATVLLIDTFPSSGRPARLQIVVDREDDRVMVEAIVRRRRS